MRRHTLCLSIGVSLLFSIPASCRARSARTVALTGKAADSSGGDPLNFTQIGTATINRYGQVALVARAQATGQPVAGGVWSEGGNEGLRLVALDGRAAPGVSGGIYTALSENYPLINNAGQTLYGARLNIVPGITSSNDSGAWIATPGQTSSLVLREGSTAPGTLPGAVFATQTDVVGERYAAFNDLGQVATLTQLVIGTGGITGNNDFGVWRAGGGGPTLAAGVEGTVAAGISPTRYYDNLSGTAQINALGQVAISAPLKTTATGTTSAGSGIWFGDPATGLSLLARDGQVAPGTNGATFGFFARPSINNAGDYVFYGSLNIGGDVTAQNGSAVWTARHGNPLALLARGEDHAPGTGPAVGFVGFSNTQINAAGRIAFSAVLAGIPDAGDSGITTLNDTGIWSDSGGAGLQLIARENDQAPDVPTGVLFDVLQQPTLNAAGRIAFQSDLRGANITSANNTGIWMQDAAGALHLIAREGDTIDVDDGPGVDLRTVSQLVLFADSGGEDGERTGLSASGELAFTAAFTDASAGVFVVNLPNFVPGDYNQNGIVDAADYTVWRDSLGSTTNLTADGNDNKTIDLDDYNVWKAHFGQHGGSGAASAVPNPQRLRYSHWPSPCSRRSPFVAARKLGKGMARLPLSQGDDRQL